MATQRQSLGLGGIPLGLLLQDVQAHTLALGQADEGLVILADDEHIPQPAVHTSHPVNLVCNHMNRACKILLDSS